MDDVYTSLISFEISNMNRIELPSTSILAMYHSFLTQQQNCSYLDSFINRGHYI